jgi:ABC-type transport system involved in multi-copper enzyme maturation permease subunit
MSLARLGLVWRLDLGQHLRRPMFWILLLTLGLTAFGLSSGKVQIASGDSTVGGQKAWITSEFGVAQLLTLVVFLLYSFFIAVLAGMGVVHDEELKVGELLHATPLRPGEYVWGKFLAVLGLFLAVLGFQLLAMMFCNHLVPDAKAIEVRGPFELINYLRPALVFSVPTVVFLTGTAFAVGALTRKPILVFVLPVALLLACAFFLWEWAPLWLDPQTDRVLMLLDPAGFRWLSRTWLRVDRGVAFYNHAHMAFDLPFLVSRLVYVFLGLAAVVVAQWRLAGILREARQTRHGWLGRLWPVGKRRATSEPEPEAAIRHQRRLTDLGMTNRPPGLWRGISLVAAVELRELRAHPGLYLFVPIILLQVIGTSLVAVGAFGTPLLLTPGTLAVGTMNTLTLLVCLLLLFYVVESVQRERHTALGSIYYATPVTSAAILFGKVLANCVVGVVVLLAALTACAVALLIQSQVAFAIWPFLLTWGLLLTTTFLVWAAFVTAVLALTRSRYTTYAVGLAALIYTGYRQSTGQMSWVSNWDLWSALHWSDLGVFEVDRLALVLNRLLVLALAVFFTAVAVRFFARRDLDAARLVERLRPRSLLVGGLRLLPYGAVALGLGIVLYAEVNQGFEGDAARKRRKDYWRHNLATWKDAALPAVTAVDLDLELQPDRHWFRIRGSYDLKNHHRDKHLAQVPLTGGDHWQNVQWTMAGQDYEPDNRSHLYVFTPDRPLAPGDRLRIGFAYEGKYPDGVSNNGGPRSEFILPSGVVLTSFVPSFAPVLGYLEEVGIDDDNRYEWRVYPDNFYEGITEPLFGSATAFTTKIRVTAPEAYTVNSVGRQVSECLEDGRRTVVWQSDQPVRFFNVIAGRWAVRRGKDTAIYYHPGHAYNLDEMAEALDAARHYYSEWFYPYPWRELKLSEFPNLAMYAQGFPTNITFAEGIGFLTKSDPRANLAFVVTAHEAAHQWWGNLLLPGKGLGGNVLCEGMAHFSTILLCEQVKGLRQRIEFCKRIEEKYGEDRRKDSEKPLVQTDGSRPGDTTVMYDKGAWVFWMLLRHMGRERNLQGLREFIGRYRQGPDHPMLQDFTATLRPFAADPAAYDAFVRQWFHKVVVPEYRLSEVRLAPVAASSPEAWELTVRVENAGTGRMPVEVAAARRERFDEKGKVNADYRDARVMVNLGAGEARTVTIRCDFKPDRVLVDPDVVVFQLLRKLAVAQVP